MTRRPGFRVPPSFSYSCACSSCRDESTARLLPTVSCARLAQEIALTYQSYVDLANRVPGLSRKKFMKALMLPREVCEFNDCCQYIREAVTEEQRAWIDAHATHDQVGGDKDVLSGKVSYRGLRNA